MYLFRKGLSLFIAMVMLVAMVPAMTIGVAAQDATEEEQMKSIRQKLTTYFLERDTFDDGATAGKCYSSRAGEYFAIQQTDGSWADVDYYCTETAANGKTWEPYLALDRMQAMAMAYADPNGTWYHDAAMLQGVENAFSYWASIRDANPEKDDYEGPWSVNWWENGNGVQLRFSRIGVVLKDVLSDKATGIILRKLDVNGSTGSGQNALWCTQNALYRALIAEDAAQFKKVVTENLSVNLRRGGLIDEAIQVDNTFHCHGNLLYTNGYGASLFRDMSFWIDTLAGTDFALPQSVIDLMAEYMLDGTRWMIRGDLLEVYLGYTACVKPGYAGRYVAPLERMIKNDPTHAAEYQKVLDNILGKRADSGVSGNNYMWTSALMSQMREDYGVNVRMIHKNMKPSEFRATWPDTDYGNLIFWTVSGANTVVVDGDEYNSVYASYDWRHVPGTTAPYAIASTYGLNSANDDCWGVSNGQQGATAYTFCMDDGSKTRTYGKVGYFFFDDEYVALGAGIRSEHAQPIHTTVNQTKSADASVNGTTVAMGTSDATYTASYAYNNQVGYIFPQPTEVHVSNENQKDKYPSLWSTGYSQFGEQLDPDQLPDPQNTFSLWLDHGTKPTSSSYSYIVLPAASEEEVAAYSRENPITIIANTDKVQAVRHEGLKQTQINFYAAGSLEYTPGKTVSVDGACSLIIDESGSETTITEAVSNTQSAQTVMVSLTDSGTTTDTRFCSLSEPYAGKSITLPVGGSSLVQSSPTTGGHSTARLFDQDEETYFESTVSQAWISYDMQKALYIGDMEIRWGDQYAKAYQLQYSEDGVHWTTTYTQKNGQGGVETVPYNTIGRYWRLLCTQSSGEAYQIKEISFKTSSNMALDRPVKVSYTYSDAMPASYIVDGDASTRWAGERSRDDNWVVVDLGVETRLDAVRALWEAAYSSKYTINWSDDGENWKGITGVDGQKGWVQTALPAGTSGRYLRILGEKAALRQYGMSIYELEIYGAPLVEVASDKLSLKKAIDLVVRDDVYTPESYAAYQQALAAATDVYEAVYATQPEVDAALDALKAAQQQLVFRYFGETLATVKGTTLNISGGGKIFSLNWTKLSQTLDLSKEDLNKIYLFATVDVTRNPDKVENNMFGNGRVLLRSPNTGSSENNVWINTNTLVNQLGRNVLYFPLTDMTNKTGEMDWSKVETFRLYIDSVNRVDGDLSLTLSDVQIIRTNEPAKVRVACVGDSITAGAGASSVSQNYVSRLQKQLGSRYTVQNFGNSGKTLINDSADGNDYVKSDTYQKSLEFQPDVVTIMLGTNDSKDQNWKSPYKERYEQDLRELVNIYRALPSHPVVILATSPTAYSHNFNINNSNIESEIAPLQRKVAAEMGCPLIDANAATKGLDGAVYFSDGVHPSDTGHALLANLFEEGIRAAGARLYGFAVDGQQAVIDDAAGTVSLTLPADTDLTALAPELTLMTSATATPSGAADYTQPVTLTITAPDQSTTRVYTVTITREQPVYTPGDVNGDQQVDAVDALMTLQAAADKITLTNTQHLAADMDKDGNITAADALTVLRRATGF